MVGLQTRPFPLKTHISDQCIAQFEPHVKSHSLHSCWNVRHLQFELSQGTILFIDCLA